MFKLFNLGIWMISYILNKSVFENTMNLLTHLFLNTRALLYSYCCCKLSYYQGCLAFVNGYYCYNCPELFILNKPHDLKQCQEQGREDIYRRHVGLVRVCSSDF